MKGLKKLLVAEQKRLETIIKQVNERLHEAPEGTLRISKNKNYIQYYHCTDENKVGSYIVKKKEGLVHELAQKTYDEKVLRLTLKRIGQLNRILRDYEDDEVERIFLQEHAMRRCLIEPVEPTWEQKLKLWKATEYKGKGFQEDTPVILTEQGERVRSKSEKIMADYFYRNGIEYKYECPLYLKGVGMIYPDFTFLSPKTGKELYWEHNGMVDDPTYARRMVRKIHAYENNGIFIGERLILTYETEQCVLSSEKIAQMVNKYLV